MTKRGLGRGLDAFFNSPEAGVAGEQVVEINVAEISANPFQPRKVFDDEALAELSKSITQYGVLQPIVLRKTVSGYQIVSGERRWRATQGAGKKTIPAVIREYTDAEMTEIALIENLQRENLNPIEEAYAFKKLMQEFGLTQEEVSHKIGRSRSHIANIIRLTNLHPEIQDYISHGTLNMGQAKPLLGIEDQELQLKLAMQILDDDLTSRDVEELVRVKGKSSKTKSENVKEYYINEAEDRLKLFFGAQVRIKYGKNKGKIEIDYTSQAELERIVETLVDDIEKHKMLTANSLVV